MNQNVDHATRSYHYQRAEQELERARRSAHPSAVKAHYTLAGHYLDRFYGDPGVRAPQAE